MCFGVSPVNIIAFFKVNMGPKRIPSNTSNLLEESSRRIQVSSDSQLIIKEMKEEFDMIKREIKDLKSKFGEFLAQKDEEISELKGEIGGLKEKVKELNNVLDDNEAYERRDTVVVSGGGLPVVQRGENCSEIVRELIKKELKLTIPISEISTTHRIGSKPNNQMPDKRNFIIKFCRRDCKRELILASKKIRNPNLVVHENLTPKRRNVFQILRRIKRDHPELVKGVSSYEGRVFAYTPNLVNPSFRDQRHLVNTMDSLTTFCREHVKQPLDNFLGGFVRSV